MTQAGQIPKLLKLDLEKRDALIRYYKSVGLSHGTIAKIMGLTNSSVGRILNSDVTVTSKIIDESFDAENRIGRALSDADTIQSQIMQLTSLIIDRINTEDGVKVKDIATAIKSLASASEDMRQTWSALRKTVPTTRRRYSLAELIQASYTIPESDVPIEDIDGIFCEDAIDSDDAGNIGAIEGIEGIKVSEGIDDGVGIERIGGIISHPPPNPVSPNSTPVSTPVSLPNTKKKKKKGETILPRRVRTIVTPKKVLDGHKPTKINLNGSYLQDRVRERVIAIDEAGGEEALRAKEIAALRAKRIAERAKKREEREAALKNEKRT